ncbi:MAG TPA: hypothetical protein VD770_02025, partial [Coxiellaceae bacterium]|nr:hypothetical protein [Coxiellaceae bacterium]
AYYQNSTSAYTEQATVVGNIGLPTGSANKQPPTGTGAMSYFAGATYNRTYVNWFLFLSPGVNFYDSYHNIEYGNKYLYQWGFGWNLFEIGTRWIIAAVSEFDGQYTAKSKISGITNPNSGGNIIYFTPSISAGATHLSLQAGVGIPIVQNLYGQQTRTNYLLALSMSYVF